MAQETCPSCWEEFTGTSAGDMHRVGKHHIFAGPDRRRCLTVDEMLEMGMIRNQRGVWMTRAGSNRPIWALPYTAKTA